MDHVFIFIFLLTEASRKRRETTECDNGEMVDEECVCNKGFSMNDGNCEADGMLKHFFLFNIKYRSCYNFLGHV